MRNLPFAYEKTKVQISNLPFAYEKTKVQISNFVFTKQIERLLYFLNTKFQASSHPDCTARFVSDLVENPDDGFSQDAAQ